MLLLTQSKSYSSKGCTIMISAVRKHLPGPAGVLGSRRSMFVLPVAGLILVLALVAAGCGGAALGQTASPSSSATSQQSNGPVVSASSSLGTSPAEAVASKVGSSVVNVRVTGVASSQSFGNQPYEGVGSGVIYSSDGYIVTNNHVVSVGGTPAQSIEVTLSTGEKMPARIISRDSYTDLAIIKVDKTGLPAATFAHSSDVKLGEYAIAIGSPLDYSNSVTLGIVSGMGRSIDNAGPGSQSLVDLIQTDAAISPGNSGGALLDSQGRVIGINVAYLPPAQTGAENIGFAIPADTVVRVAQQLVSGGTVSHPYMGISYTTITSALQQQYGLSRSNGVLITQVGQGSPAEKAGLQQGDIVLSMGGTTVTQEGDLVSILGQKKVGETIPVTVERNGRQMTLQVTLVERPSAVQ
jgi:S1-C subfamily serine protease